MFARAVPIACALLLKGCGVGQGQALLVNWEKRQDGPPLSNEPTGPGPQPTADAGLPPGPTPACPRFSAAIALGPVASGAATELSGIALSRKNPGVVWAHNDSGDTARVLAMTRTGAHLGIYAVARASAIDWEDMAIGTGPVPGESYLYLADIGDNLRVRATVQVYQVREPTVSPTQSPVAVTLTGAARIDLSYPDGPHNAESLLFDPLSGALFIATKSETGSSRVYTKPAPHAAGAAMLSWVTELWFDSPALPGPPEVTGGDISFDGGQIALKTLTSQYLWRRAAGESVASALSGEACPVPAGPGEAVGFAREGSYFSVAEGVAPTLFQFDPL